jgi:DNA-binding beta-propeller fold protein YncE
MRNRICFSVMILVSMLLAACGESADETPEVTSGEPEATVTEVPEPTTGEPAPETSAVTAEEPHEPVSTAPTLLIGEPIDIGMYPRIATDDEYIWVASAESDTIVRIDPAVHAVTGALRGLGIHGDVAALDGQVWVIADSWLEIDREAMEIVDSMPAFVEAYDLAGGFGSLWVVSNYEDIVPASSTIPGGAIPDPDILRIDPQEGAATARIPIEGVCLTPGLGQTPAVLQLDAFDDAVWALTFCDGDPGYVAVHRIDPDTNTAERVAVVSGEDDGEISVQAMTVVDGTPWLAAGYLDSESGIPSWLIRIDTDTGTYDELGELGRWPRGIAYVNGFLWVTDCADATVTQVDPSTGDVVCEPILIGTSAPENVNEAEDFSCPGEIVGHGNTLWVTTIIDGTVIPIDMGN